MRRSAIVMGFSLALAIASAGSSKIIYVDDDANAPGDGKSWATAYRYLQDGLADAKTADKPVEIRVGQGLYKPDQGASQKTGDRRASFALIRGVVLKGGYAGITTADPNAQDVKLYETILSGDLTGNDVLSKDPADFVVDPNDGNWDRPNVWNILVESTRRENSLHVLNASGADQTAILEGFTVTAGNAYRPPYWFGSLPAGLGEDDQGGAIFNKGGSPVLRSSTFISNSAIGGGAVAYNEGPCSLTMLGCHFLDNFTWTGGGTVYSHLVDLVMNDCVFERNQGVAATYSVECHHGIVDCRFSMNGRTGDTAFAVAAVRKGHGSFEHCDFEYNYGGVAVMDGSNIVLQDCRLIGNSGVEGGGMNCSGVSKVKLDKCMFVRNRAALGGGLYISSTELSVSNCLFYGNQTDFAGFGGGGAGAAVHGNSVVDVRSSVFWNNQSPAGYEIALLLRSEGPTPSRGTIAYCLIEGGQAGIWTGRGYSFVTEAPPKDRPGVFVWGPGNIDADPMFADPNRGDYHLKSQAGRWDPVNSSWVVDHVTSPCIDAGDPGGAIGYEPFPNGGRINIGVYGGTAEASKSYFGKPACEKIIAGDINGDCRVDFIDLGMLASHWLDQHDDEPSEQDENGQGQGEQVPGDSPSR